MSIFTGANLPNASKITIEGRHGVRQSYFPGGFGGTDVPTTLYQVSISLDKFKEYDWLKIELEKIMELWTVDKNIIPELQFQLEIR
jgi:hypothetical protein